jgi:hypothetical protein
MKQAASFFDGVMLGLLFNFEDEGNETMVDFQRTTWRYVPEDGTLYNHHCENLKSYT